jgi:SUMO ligase MMS21 Smc5/6 complex component
MHTTCRFLILLLWPESSHEYRTTTEMTKKILANDSEGIREVDAQNQRMKFILVTIRMTGTVIEDLKTGFRMYGQ